MSKVDSGVFEETKVKTSEKREVAEAKQLPKPALRTKAGPKQAMTDEEVMAGLGERNNSERCFFHLCLYAFRHLLLLVFCLHTFIYLSL